MKEIIFRAHAKAYRVYENEFKSKQGGVCGITLDCNWYEPKTNSPQDKQAAQLSFENHSLRRKF